MKKILIGLLALMTTFVSCTDQEDIEIAYKSEIGITAAHIFDDYEQFLEGDFDMSKDGWKLNLQVLVYDESGVLAEKSEKLCQDLSETLNYSPTLTPGNYTVVSIAEFREGLGGKNYKFWNIENESNLHDLSITESDSYYPVPFETLGIDIKKINVTDRSQTISADIKPVTSLVQIFTSDKDYSGWGIQGYSRFAALTEGYFIKAIKAKNNIRFEDDALSYKYSEQQSDYNLAISRVYEKWSEKKAPTSYSYRALLPEENKGFSFHIQKRDLPEEYYDTFAKFCGEFEEDGNSNQLLDIKSNKQYVVNMILDAMQLVVMDYPIDYRHEIYTQQYVSDYNDQLLLDMVNIPYENILSKNESYANTFLDSEPTSHKLTGQPYFAYYPRSRANHFEQFVTTAFLDEDLSCCCLVQLLLPELSEDTFNSLKSLLSSKYKAEKEGLYGPNNFTYLDPETSEEDSKFRVILQKEYNKENDKYVYFYNFVLREKFYPNNDLKDLWPDFTMLFGSDNIALKSALEGYGFSFLFSDSSYSVNGSDYYLMNNNEYADMIGFVFNPDNQVSQFWVYYKSNKVNDVNAYLSQKYTAASSESTSNSLVFYNSKMDIKVVLDKLNGAVVYTNLSMKQHDTPK